MRKVEWTWVKGHNGYLLNECADMLATKGVNNETPFSNVQYVHPINEDVDFQTYELQDGEETRVESGWKGDRRGYRRTLRASEGHNGPSTGLTPKWGRPSSQPNIPRRRFIILFLDKEN
jgi:hypothetical protein